VIGEGGFGMAGQAGFFDLDERYVAERQRRFLGAAVADGGFRDLS